MAGKRPAASASEYTTAAEWFRKRTPMTKDVWLALEGRAQRQAFTVAGVAQLSLIAEVQTSLMKAVREGQSLEQWKKGIKTKLLAEWAGSVSNPAARLETIFRTNVQMAFAQGRREQMLEPSVVRYRPYWRYLATLDNRTSTICRQLDGTVLPAHHYFWRSHTPPLHFQCRGTIQALTRTQAEARGLTQEVPQVPAQGGFGGADLIQWQPDLTKYPPKLVKEYERKAAVTKRKLDKKLLPDVPQPPAPSVMEPEPMPRVLHHPPPPKPPRSGASAPPPSPKKKKRK